MKKLILSALVVGSLLATSCKGKKEDGKDLKETTSEVANDIAQGAKDGANAVADGVKDGANAVTEGTKNLAEKASGAMSSAVEGVTIPKFEDPKVGAYLQEYSEYAKEYIAEGKDVAKNSELMKKGAELGTKVADVTKDLSAEAKVKFTKTLTAIQSKMAPAN